MIHNSLSTTPKIIQITINACNFYKLTTRLTKSQPTNCRLTAVECTDYLPHITTAADSIGQLLNYKK